MSDRVSSFLTEDEAGKKTNTIMIVLRSSGISRKLALLIVRYSQKKELISIVFYCSENHSIAHNLETTGPIQVGF